MKKWDLFISHASEDKREVAQPLAEKLIRCGLRVWLDRFELKLGDSLREKIDEGLSESAFGVVILSERFFEKGWPKKELNGLFTLEEDGSKVILPVWHGVDKAAVARYSPILADRLAADTKDGIFVVAQAIAQAVLPGEDERRSRKSSLLHQFVEILNQGALPVTVSSFLTIYPRVMPAALGHFGLRPESADYLVRPSLGDVQPDLSVGKSSGTSGDYSWWHLFFCPVSGPFFERGIPIGVLKEAVEKIQTLEAWLRVHSDEARKLLLPDNRWGSSIERDDHRSIMVVGRRESFSEDDRQCLRRLRDQGSYVRSYDWLVEACAVAESNAQGG